MQIDLFIVDTNLLQFADPDDHHITRQLHQADRLESELRQRWYGQNHPVQGNDRHLRGTCISYATR